MHDPHIVSREVHLKERPLGLPKASDLEIVSVSLPRDVHERILIRNRYFVISPSLRLMISDGAEAMPGIPFPVLAPGDTLPGEALGTVLAAPEASGFSVGDTVVHMNGWREFAMVSAAQCRRIETSDALGDIANLGHGWTAYAALTRAVRIRPTDTVFVSSAAGAIGSMAGQIARLLGARRVIGSTSSQRKADWLVGTLGYDAAIRRGEGGAIVDQLREAAPDGVDVVLDMVGGEQLAAAVTVANEGARCVLIGGLSGQLAASGTGRASPVTLDSTQIVLKRISLKGYSADDDPDAREEWPARLAAWLKTGDIHIAHTLIEGLDQAPAALEAAAAGEHMGSVIVRL